MKTLTTLVFLLSFMCGVLYSQTTSPYTNMQWKLAKPLYPACTSAAEIRTATVKCTIVTRDDKGVWVVKNWWMPTIDPKLSLNSPLSLDSKTVPATSRRPDWDQLRTLMNMRKLTKYFREEIDY